MLLQKKNLINIILQICHISIIQVKIQDLKLGETQVKTIYGIGLALHIMMMLLGVVQYQVTEYVVQKVMVHLLV
jgi:hypothetical protein